MPGSLVMKMPDVSAILECWKLFKKQENYFAVDIVPNNTETVISIHFVQQKLQWEGKQSFFVRNVL